jgi:hypothetical protein
MLKKTTLVILGLAASGFAAAGYSAPPALSCASGEVTTPCAVSHQWNISVQALYLKPIYNANKGYDYGTNINSVKELDGDWGWGYHLEGSYHFNTGNDITMTWMHYDVDTKRGGYVGATPFSLTRVPYILFFDNKFDQVNLIMGQHTNMSMLQNTRFYGGLQYADIRVHAVNTFTTTPLAITPLAPAGFRQYRDADFSGLGPIVGLDYAYNVIHNLNLTANTAASILYGSSRYSASYILAPSGLVRNDVYASKKAIVPSLEAKLGVNYTYEVAQGVLNLEGGYQVVNYFNALQTRKIANTGMPTDSDFGLYGPYFGVKWVGNA